MIGALEWTARPGSRNEQHSWIGFPSISKIQISKRIAQEQGIYAITETMQNQQMDFLNPGRPPVRDGQQEI